MKNHPTSADANKPGEPTTLTVLGARFIWVFAGPVSLVFTTFGIIRNGTGWMTGLDAIFGVVVGLMLLSRWIEQRTGTAMTPTGEPATEFQFRRYMKLLPVLAISAWIVANTVGNHLLN